MKALERFFIFLKGIVVGIANIIPGVSGGTMAVVLGIYERTIAAISGIFTQPKQFLSHFLFLALLGVGAIIGIKGLAPVITYALEHHQQLTLLFFMGLITGSIPTVVHASQVKRISIVDMLMLAVGAMLVLGLGSLPETSGAQNASTQWLILSGILAGGAMIIPGVSGSLILILLGSYSPILEAIDKLQWSTLAIFGAATASGIVVFSLIIRALLKHRPNATHSFIFGLVGASVIILFKGFPTGSLGILYGTLSFAVGAILAHASGNTKAEA